MKLLILKACFSILFVVQLYQVKFGHGTIFPVVTLLHSREYAPNYSVDPPLEFNRVSAVPRVVVSLTSMPENVEHLKETIDTLINQTYPIDAIYINLPKKNKRTNEVYPDFPLWLDNKKYNIVKKHVLPRDYGPLSKLMGALLVEKDPSTIIITVDDDKLYAPNLVEKLVWNSLNNPDAAFGPCGWVHIPMLRPEKIIPGYFFWFIRGAGRQIDTLQACCGKHLLKGFFITCELK